MQISDETNISPLNDWDIIQVYGEESSIFLQNLLTIDVNKVPLTTSNSTDEISYSQLAGFCSAQGRLISTFWISKYITHNVESFIIWISKDLAADFSNRLRKFILRSKVTVEYKENEYLILGITTKSPTPNFSKLLTGATYKTHLPTVIHEGIPFNRRIFAISKSEAVNFPKENISNSKLWDLIEVESGIPRITKNTQEAFVPQMVNIESLGGIDFKKGCYPGQEVVARSQYRGAIKRRLKLAKIDLNGRSHTLPNPGDEIFNIENLDQPAGMVVLSAISNNNEVLLQIEIKLDQLNSKLVIYPGTENQLLISEIKDQPYLIIEI